MSAENLGRRLLGEVQEESLDEVCLSHVITLPPSLDTDMCYLAPTFSASTP